MAQQYYYIAHHGIKGQKWGVRRYQNPDGTLTELGKKRYVKALNENRYVDSETGEVRFSTAGSRSRERHQRNVNRTGAGIAVASTVAGLGFTPLSIGVGSLVGASTVLAANAIASVRARNKRRKDRATVLYNSIFGTTADGNAQTRLTNDVLDDITEEVTKRVGKNNKKLDEKIEKEVAKTLKRMSATYVKDVKTYSEEEKAQVAKMYDEYSKRMSRT